MIFKGSRYEKQAASAYTVLSADGLQHRALPIRFAPPTPATYQHTLSAGERLDTLAFHFYSNAEKFWLIADANRVIDPETLLQPGRPILIPPDPGG
jgi:nucleoid-associated protein YgaU